VTGQRLLNEYPMLDFIWTDDGPELECLMPTEWFPIQVEIVGVKESSFLN
jgi:hypothetical protein